MNERPATYGYGTIARTFLAVLVLDQLTKEIVRRFLPLQGDVWPAADGGFGGFFQFLHAHNTGVAFGFAQGRNGLHLVIALTVVIALLVFARGLHPAERWMRVALGCQIGGALGNAVDRMRLGHVTDFLDLHYGDWRWPTFNVADIAINVGVWLLILRLWRTESGSPREQA